MSSDGWDDSIAYSVVVNHEGQYSIWPADRERPAGWGEVGMQGGKADCLAYVATVWTDMRPRSLRLRMDSEGAAGVLEKDE